MNSKGKLKFTKDPVGTVDGYGDRFRVSVGGVDLPLFLIDDEDTWGVSYQSSLIANMRRHPILSKLPRIATRRRKTISRKTAVGYLRILLDAIPASTWDHIVYTLQRHPEVFIQVEEVV